MDHPHPWLKYFDADDLGSAATALKDLVVTNPAGDILGRGRGVIADAKAPRLPYIVVDAGGWFRSRQFLIPTGLATLLANNRLLVNLPKDRVARFPGFDKHVFEGSMA